MTTIHHFTFDFPLKFNQIPAFRGALIKLMGNQVHPLMHNHSEDGLRYAYPMVQYKIVDSHPTMTAIGDIGEIFHNFIADKDTLQLSIGTKKVNCNISNYAKSEYEAVVDDKPRLYTISNYIPLTEENVDTYESLMAYTDKISLIESILTGNILSFFKGINHHADNQITCVVESVQNIDHISYKKVLFKSFHLKFVANVLLPDYIGLGKSTSVGMGVVQQLPFPEKYNKYLADITV